MLSSNSDCHTKQLNFPNLITSSVHADISIGCGRQNPKENKIISNSNIRSPKRTHSKGWEPNLLPKKLQRVPYANEIVNLIAEGKRVKTSQANR